MNDVGIVRQYCEGREEITVIATISAYIRCISWNLEFCPVWGRGGDGGLGSRGCLPSRACHRGPGCSCELQSLKQ